MSDESPSFGLTIAVLAKTPFVAIAPDEFAALKAAKRLLVESLALEESFSRMIGNYYEYEAGLLTGALHYLVYDIGSWSETAGDIHEVNRRVMNLLSGVRACRDQAAHFVSAEFGSDSEEVTAFQEWTNAVYESALGYRVGEALRNHTQHRGLAVHSLHHTMWRVEERAGPGLRTALVPEISPQRLAEDGDFKASVLQELGALGTSVDLRPLMREYVAGMAQIQEKLRDLLHARLERADELLLGAIARYEREGQKKTLGLAAVKVEPEGRWSDQVHLFADLVERRRTLVRRTRRIRHLGHQYTTNEPGPSK